VRISNGFMFVAPFKRTKREVVVSKPEVEIVPKYQKI
jgi:hypothetical protein